MRISPTKALELFQKTPLEELQKQAQEIRFQKNPENKVSFVLDSNPNYTNVCNADCSFCAFYRKKNAKDAYTKSVDEVMEHLELARKAGLSTVMLQGGLNDTLKIDYYEKLVRSARKHYPDIYPHFFTAPELWNCAKVSNISIDELFQRLYSSGLRSLPGGGAEILSERVRLAISPKKMEPGAWIQVHRSAHKAGLRSTATMMYGHLEEAEDIVEHFDQLRKLQDETKAFTAFIPWSYKRERTALRRKVKHWAGEDSYLRIIALSRIYLDNFDHIQASWFSEGKETGKRALQSGADDFGGIIFEENVHKATGFVHRMDHQGIVDLIQEAGFEAFQRNPLYEVLRTYKDPKENIYMPDIQKQKKEENALSALKASF